MKKRMTALLMVCAMVCTAAFGCIPGVYAEEVEPIRIEGESLTGTGISTLSNKALSGGQALLFSGSAGVNNTLAYSVDVEKAGLYTLTVKSSRQGSRYVGDGTLQWPSPYWVKVNSEDPFTFSEGSAYDKYGYGKGMVITSTTKADGAPGNFNGADPVIYTIYEIPVYLNAGNNTVSFIVKDRHYNGKDTLNDVKNAEKKVYFYLDYIEFTYQSSGAANLPVLVQGEEYAYTNVPEAGRSELTDSALNDGAALKISTAETIPADGFYVDYTATVAKEGMYTLEFSSSIQGYETAGEGGNTDCQAASPYTVKVNDGNAVSFNDFSGYRRSEKTAGGMKLVTYAMEVHLNRGVNTVRFAAAQGCVNDNTVIFALDYLKLSPLMHYFADDFKVEGESFSKSSVAYAANNCCVRDNIGLSNDKDAYFTIASAVPVVDYEFYVEKEGDYAVYTTVMTDENQYTSDLDISFNGGDYITIVNDNTTSKRVAIVTPQKNADLYGTFVLKSALVHLNKGYNQMSIKANNLTTKGPIRYTMGVDYVRFVKAGTSVAQNANHANYKNETMGVMNNMVNFRFNSLERSLSEKDEDGERIISGIYVPELKTEVGVTENAYVEHSFFVGEDGNYTLTVDCGGNISGTYGYASECGISLDGGNLTQLTANNTSQKSLGSGVDAKAFGSYTLNDPVALTKGWHTLRFESMGAAPLQNGKTIIYWQGFTLEKADNVDTAKILLVDPVITVKESTQAKITYLSAAGDEVKPEGYSATWLSSNENIAEVDSNGKIKAFNPGKTVITACISDEDNRAVGTGTYEAELIVLPETSTLFVQEAQRDDSAGKITVQVASAGDMQEDVSVIVGSYQKENGMPTTLKSISVVPISGLKNGISKTIDVDIAGLKAEDTVALFVWQNMDTMIPLWTRDIIEVQN